jgi:hypothetical protein
MWETNKCLDQPGVAEDKKTPDKCIQDRVCDIKTDTERTPIFTMVENIMSLDDNIFLPKLRKLLDSNGHIRSVQQREDVLETLRLFFFEYGKKPRWKVGEGVVRRDSSKQAQRDFLEVMVPVGETGGFGVNFGVHWVFRIQAKFNTHCLNLVY